MLFHTNYIAIIAIIKFSLLALIPVFIRFLLDELQQRYSVSVQSVLGVKTM